MKDLMNSQGYSDWMLNPREWVLWVLYREGRRNAESEVISGIDKNRLITTEHYARRSPGQSTLC